MSVQIPEDAAIPVTKLTRYLLIERSRDDKSKFLAKAGFTLNNYEALDTALRKLMLSTKAFEDRTDRYGTFYQIVGSLEGTNGVSLDVVTIWLQRKIDSEFHFITLFPNK